ncbi:MULTISPECIES: nitrous oxide-stimulated promoter family protein [Desulfosporosinus]|uniref:nitrous oxide-stimulated promoter family protein n=1 Tax=Desulfosporosinus TaxID=79206 RepID=UPI0009344A33|nr:MULTISPECIES: nitrous oxide-stimulated promoter family protein [Desulfosporosinus]MCB8818169.1 nitrous oxide-stimulated promoter family protein [Desulfosporosinus sp. SRJS8]
MSNRLEREKATAQMMIKLYCKGHHHSADSELCSECQELLEYATNRLNHCKFGESKPTCAKCTVHCYKPEMRKKIQETMRYSGPKMIYNHPIAAIRHLWDGLRK